MTYFSGLWPCSICCVDDVDRGSFCFFFVICLLKSAVGWVLGDKTKTNVFSVIFHFIAAERRLFIHQLPVVVGCTG